MSNDLDLQRLLDDPRADLSEVALLRAGRAEVMSDETRRKVLAGIGVGGAALGLATVGSSVSQGSAGWVSWPAWLKTGLVLSALGGVAGSLAFFGVGSRQASAPSTQQAPEPEQPQAAARPTTGAAPPAVQEAPVYQAADLPVEQGAAAKPSKDRSQTQSGAQQSAPPPAPTESSLAAELEAIRPAKARLAAGDAAGAIAQLRRYRSQFPNGKLGVEATVIEVEALVALGQRAAAQKLAAPLLKSDSPYAARLRSLLGLDATGRPSSDKP